MQEKIVENIMFYRIIAYIKPHKKRRNKGYLLATHTFYYSIIMLFYAAFWLRYETELWQRR